MKKIEYDKELLNLLTSFKNDGIIKGYIFIFSKDFKEVNLKVITNYIEFDKFTYEHSK